LQAINNVFPLHEPLDIKEQQSLRLTLAGCTAMTAVTEVTFVLWGTLTRPVG